MSGRAYLDWNATTPLRPEARAAMIAAMDVTGNPSSVHAEGRAAKALVERARGRIAEALGALSADIVFVSGATEAAALALSHRRLKGASLEHDAVRSWISEELTIEPDGRVQVPDPGGSVLQLANSETGCIQQLPPGLAVSDLTQGFGKIPFGFDWSGIEMGFVSAHKIGGPKGIGALILRRGLDVEPVIRGGGQEMGRRSGTENVIGIAGFAAAAEAAQADLANGTWHEVCQLRDILETSLASEESSTIFVGKGAIDRLPNTSMIVARGWKGETQVMQMDLAGFAVSAGSACSSGKVRRSQVLSAMGFDDEAASSALRVSLGPATTRDEVLRFAEAWLRHYRRRKDRAA